MEIEKDNGNLKEWEDPGSWDKSRAFCCGLIKRQNIFPKMSYLYRAIKQLCIIASFKIAVLYFIPLFFFNKEPSFSRFDIKSFRALDPCQCHAETQVTEAIHRAATGERCRDGTGRGMQEHRGGERQTLGGGQHLQQQEQWGTQVVQRAAVITSYFIES